MTIYSASSRNPRLQPALPCFVFCYKVTDEAVFLPKVPPTTLMLCQRRSRREAGLELEDVKVPLRHEDIATTSNVYGDLGMEAPKRIQGRLVAFVREQARAEDAARCESACKEARATLQ